MFGRPIPEVNRLMNFHTGLTNGLAQALERLQEAGHLLLSTNVPMSGTASGGNSCHPIKSILDWQREDFSMRTETAPSQRVTWGNKVLPIEAQDRLLSPCCLFLDSYTDF